MDQGAVPGGEGRRLIVVVEVADIVEAGLLHEVGRVQRVRDGGREPAAQPAPGEPQMRGLAVLDDLALLLLAIAPVVARIEIAVAHIFPAARFHGLEDLGIHLDDRHRQRHGAAHVVLVEDLEHPPQADPVAVVAAAIAQHVGMRHARPGIAHAHFRREVFVVFDVGADPHRHARAVGPGELRSLDDRRIAVSIGIHRIILPYVACQVHHGRRADATPRFRRNVSRFRHRSGRRSQNRYAALCAGNAGACAVCHQSGANSTSAWPTISCAPISGGRG